METRGKVSKGKWESNVVLGLGVKYRSDISNGHGLVLVMLYHGLEEGWRGGDSVYYCKQDV